MKESKRGFTLIELLVVIVIIGVLAGLLMVNFSNARLRARDVRRKSDLREIKTALNLYNSVWRQYPASDTDSRIVGCNTPPAACAWGSVWNRENTDYMKPLPADPLETGHSYEYTRVGIDSFSLVAVLENKSDNDIGASQARCSFAGADNQYVVCQD